VSSRNGVLFRAPAVEYQELVLPDEIHDFLRYASWLRIYGAAAGFLDAKLGVKAAP
jgi:dipeptidyl aminopeptidase/acylaminoacyl peptidase